MPFPNDSCVNSIALVGMSGSVTADNTDWSGTWPTGADPLWNALVGNGVSSGGGSPGWWKWTNTLSRAVDFKLTFESGIRVNVGVAVGVCGSIEFDFNNEFLGSKSWDGSTDWFLHDGEALDVIVHPGETVYIEIDSYVAGSNTEPPSSLGHRGSFTFSWTLADVTFYDSIWYSELIYDGIVPIDAGHTPEILDSIYFQGRMYIIAQTEFGGQIQVYAVDMLLDGTDVNTQLLATADTPTSNNFFTDSGGSGRFGDGRIDQLRFMTDGIELYFGFGYMYHLGDSLGNLNPDATGTCGYVSYMPSPYKLVDGAGPSGATQLRFDIYKLFEPGLWFLWHTLYQPDTGSSSTHEGPFWNLDNGGILQAWNTIRGTMDESEPGVIWVHATYSGVRGRYSHHHNFYPTGPPGTADGDHGEDECVLDEGWIQENVDTFRISTSLGDSWTDGDVFPGTVDRQVNTITYITLTGYNELLNPIFDTLGARFSYVNGPWDNTTKFDTIGYQKWWLQNDEGYPILAYNPMTQFNRDTQDFANDIIFKRLDTGTIIADFDFAEITGESDSNAHISLAGVADQLVFSKKYHNLESGLDERILTTSWQTVAPFASFKVRLTSDFSSIKYIVDGIQSTSYNGGYAPAYLIFKDGSRNWWVIAASSGQGNIDQYDELCNNNWISGYSSSIGPDHLFLDYPFGLQQGYENMGVEPPYFILANANNQLRKYPIRRNFKICTVTPFTPCPPSIIWFFADGEWRQQNVDPDFSLWYFLNGEWHQDCQELYGQLEGTWQT